MLARENALHFLSLNATLHVLANTDLCNLIPAHWEEVQG